MILDDENILMSDMQESVNNPLNIIKTIRDNYGTFNRAEVTNVLFDIFNDIPNNKDTHFLRVFLEECGWFIDIMDEHRITITEHPRKCNGYPGHLFEIITTNTNKGLLYGVRFYEYTCSLSTLIKSYMINKYKLIKVGVEWVPEQFEHEWRLNI
jgi:hypothetical protein